MKIVNKIKDCKSVLKKLKEKGRRIGFVPTMGCLHEGHLSLVRAAVKECDSVAVSIFVNPTQFGPGEDLDKYPGNFERDCMMAEKEGVGLIFHPDAAEMYPPGYGTFIEVGQPGTIMCGQFRPGHFRGVATVVMKLLDIISPDRAYFGEKDYQQIVIVKRMVEDLNLDVEIINCPTVREKDGLAMSSRNRYLSRGERKSAPILHRCLSMAVGMVAKGERDLAKIRGKAVSELKRSDFVKRVDYFDFRDPVTLEKKKVIKGTDKKILAATAVWIGGTRLIDNMIIKL